MDSAAPPHGDPHDVTRPRRDLLVAGADLVVTMDDDRRELPAAGWPAAPGSWPPWAPAATRRPAPTARCGPTAAWSRRAWSTRTTTSTRTSPAPICPRPGTLFDWLTTLYPRWALLDEEASYVSAWVGLAELALGGCTTSTDHLYVHPAGGGDLLAAEIAAARDLGIRFHPTRGSMSLSQKDGGLPPDSVVQDDDKILAASEEAVARHHDPARGPWCGSRWPRARRSRSRPT